MLTKADFSKFKELVREEVEAEGENIKSELSSDIRMWGVRTASELQEVNSRLKNLEISVRKVQKDLKKTSDFLDRENLKVVRRVDKIEEHLGFQKPQTI